MYSAGWLGGQLGCEFEGTRTDLVWCVHSLVDQSQALGVDAGDQAGVQEPLPGRAVTQSISEKRRRYARGNPQSQYRVPELCLGVRDHKVGAPEQRAPPGNGGSLHGRNHWDG